MNSKVNTQLLIFMNEMKMKKCISAAHPQCLKITEKVSYNNDNISKVDKSSLKMPKNRQVLIIFESLKLAVKKCYQTGNFSWTKIGGKCQFKCDILSDFQTL